MGVYEDTIFLMKKYNIMANKNLGQNFLIKDEIVTAIVDASQITKEDLVIEIGPGLGTLTKELLNRAGKVVAIELDKRMITILKDRFLLYDNIEILNDDILKVNLQEIIDRDRKNVKIVANLPYYITTPIIMKLLEERLPINSITVMVQKEVAQRLTAIPGTKLSGAITYTVNYYTNPEEIIVVPNNSFIPEPEVESEVIKLEIREKPIVDVKDEEKFFKTIKVSFMQRRKTLINGISNSGLASKERIKQILNELKINENVRGESLTMQDFARISEKM